MKEEFKAGLNKKFGFTDDTFIYGKNEYPYKDCSYVKVYQGPTAWTPGYAGVEVNGKKLNLVFEGRVLDRVMRAFIFMNQKIDEIKGVKRTYKYYVWAHTGTSMEVYEDHVVIDLMPNKGYVYNSMRGCGNGGKRINFSDITSIQYREPTDMLMGFLQFTYPGSVECKGGYDAILNDENSIPVSMKDSELVKEIVSFIEKKREELKKEEKTVNVVVPSASGSVADELKKFKELLDMGIITQEEFDAKKKQLLGL